MEALGFTRDEATKRWDKAFARFESGVSAPQEVIDDLDEIRLIAASLNRKDLQ